MTAVCFDLDSRPPIAPIAGGALDSRELTLTSADGTRFAAFKARAANPSGAGMIVLPDVRGLHAYYEELVLRFAEAGIDSIGIDYFARTAGIGSRGNDFDYMPHVGQLSYDAAVGDIRAAAEELRSEGRVRAVFAVGFCLGGRLAFLTPTMDAGIGGAIGFYGWPTGPHRSGSPAPADVAAQIDGAILGIFGGADQGITASVVEEFRKALVAADVEHEIVTYPGAPHSFFDRKADEFAEQSADSWRKVLHFVREHTPAD
jgi:carboxymethylenebutenolidase